MFNLDIEFGIVVAPNLKKTNEKYELIIAGDVLIYIGNLSKLFRLCSSVMTENARFIFSIEVEKTKNYSAKLTGRYSHNYNYIKKITQKIYKLGLHRLLIESGKDLMTNFLKEDLLNEIPNARTVPQIIIDDKVIGGYNELKNYLSKGN